MMSATISLYKHFKVKISVQILLLSLYVQLNFFGVIEVFSSL